FYKLGAKIVEKDLGYKDHEMKPLHALTDMAYEVAEAILKRAIRDRKIDVYWAEKYLKSVKSLDLKPEVDGEFI
ncbi:MAG: hypothetical protein QW730_06745, partial [Candidatus Nezhaarchaeales archaeon]